MKYRREIDGLRALAVLPVVLFHAHVPFFSGGFVGVDIFFVISGYLITTIIAGELDEGRFSFARFYERRARRILPALFVVTAASIPLAVWLMSPGQLEAFSRSILGVVFFVSNFQLLATDDYFADAAEVNPLIHIWSLAIEEQFYILFPILLLALWRWRKDWATPVIVAGTLFSLLLSEWASRLYPAANFYLLPTRGWELGVGALLALAELRHGRVVVGAARFLPVIGIAMIVAAITLFDGATPHPGLLTLLPVLGAMLVIRFGGAGDPGSALLSLRPVVGIGLISYSLYLWHQPLFAFTLIGYDGRRHPEHFVTLIALSTALAWLTWRYVETPFRNRAVVALRPGARAMVAAFVGFTILSVAGSTTDGLAFRKPQEIWDILAYEAQNPAFANKQGGDMCMNRGLADLCAMGDRSAPKNIALVGDSHAGVMAPAISAEMTAAGLGGVELTRVGCTYLPGFDRVDQTVSPVCRNWSDSVRSYLLAGGPETLILMGRFVRQLEGTVFDNGEGGLELGGVMGLYPHGADPATLTEVDRRAAVAAGYAAAIRELLDAGKRIVLIYPVPEAGWHVPRKLAAMREAGDLEPLTTSFQRYRERSAGVVEAFDSIPDHPNLVRVHPESIFCDTFVGGRCAAHDRDRLFYVDDDHLSADGAKLVAAEIFRVTEAKWPDFGKSSHAEAAK